MTNLSIFSKIFRSSIILLFALFTISIFNVSSYILGQNNICSSDKNEVDKKCENNCFCDRDHLSHTIDFEKIILNKCQTISYKIFLTKTLFIEEKVNSPPII